MPWRTLLACLVTVAIAAPARANPTPLEVVGEAQTTAKLLPGTRIVRAFSAVDATAIEASAKRKDGKLGVPIASDDAEAMQVVAQLVRDAGCEPVIVGNLAAATRDAQGSARAGALQPAILAPKPQRGRGSPAGPERSGGAAKRLEAGPRVGSVEASETTNVKGRHHEAPDLDVTRLAQHRAATVGRDRAPCCR